LQDYFGGIFFNASVISPFSGLQRSFNIKLRAFFDIIFHRIKSKKFKDKKSGLNKNSSGACSLTNKGAPKTGKAEFRRRNWKI
jgi:hypothetical protein